MYDQELISAILADTARIIAEVDLNLAIWQIEIAWIELNAN
jgi:hypothetical protein